MDINLIKSVGLALAGNSLIAVGQGTQKSQVGSIQAHESRGHKFRRLLLWGVGILSSNLGLVLIYKGIALGHTTIVGTLSGSGLITLVLFSHFVLKEKIQAKELWGVILIFLGVLFLPLWPLENTARYVRNDLLFLGTAAVILMVCLLLILIEKRRGNTVGTILALLAGSMTGFSQIYQKVSSTENIPLYLQSSFYIFLALFLLSFSSMQLAYRRHRAITVIPYFNATAVLVPLIGGQVFFAERLSWVQWLCVAVIGAGMVLIDLAFRWEEGLGHK